MSSFCFFNAIGRPHLYYSKRSFYFYIIGNSLLLNHSPSEWFCYTGKSTETTCFGAFHWRRVRDLNPGYGITAHTISSRAPSTTQPTLQIFCFLFTTHRSDLDYYMTDTAISQAFLRKILKIFFLFLFCNKKRTVQPIFNGCTVFSQQISPSSG